uniref:Co-chaperonin GroES n=1 Tax=uncultured virus TaxID=340016 RepID=A0A221S3V2_9VIRU|nr:co-chaperonin GroES [uncultured virus]
MTDVAEALDLDAAKEGVKSLYTAPKQKVLDPDAMDKSLLDRMPQPTGWRMLILPYRGKETTEGGIYIPNKVLDDTQIQTVVGYVVKQGPLCYKDTDKFPDGPWCKEKQWVVFARYAGSRFRIEGGECRIINDDEILAVIEDPEDILSL